MVSGSTGLALAWLLILAGPPGWLGLLVIAVLQRPGDALTVSLPLCDAVRARSRHMVRVRRQCIAVSLGLLNMAFFGLMQCSAGVHPNFAAALRGQDVPLAR